MASLEASCPGPWPQHDGLASVDLLARAQAGDSAALEAFVTRYQERLLRIVRIRLGPSGSGLRRYLESTDVVQETWQAALAALGDLQVRGNAELLGWFARIASNEIRDLLDRVQAQRRALDRERPLSEAGSGARTESSGDPAHQAERTEIREILDEAIAGLPEDYREVIVLRDYCGADWASIAPRVGRDGVHAAQQLHQRAWMRVRRSAAARLR